MTKVVAKLALEHNHIFSAVITAMPCLYQFKQMMQFTWFQHDVNIKNIIFILGRLFVFSCVQV